MYLAKLSLCASVLTLLVGGNSSALAKEDHRERDHWHGDIRHFHEHDLAVWRRGHWYQGLHGERRGWWWVVDGVWYSYDRKVAEIPDPFLPPTVVVQVPAPSAPVYVPPPPPPSAPLPSASPPPAAPATWYYCANPHGYYPYVTACPGGWASVPATAPPTGP